MKKVWIWIGAGVGLIVLIGIIFISLLPKGLETASGESEEGIEVQKVTERKLNETILVTGKVVPEDEQKVYLDPERGEVATFNVKENQKVKAGDPLFTYDTSKINAEYNRAVRERDVIQKRINAEAEQINEIKKQIADAKKNQQPRELIKELSNEKKQLEIGYESTKTEKESIQAEINELQAQQQEMTVKSKIDGVVAKVNKNIVKTEAGVEEVAIHIISNAPYKVIGKMSEFDAVKIKPQQPVIIRPKVFKEREWKGEVESVSQFPENDMEEQEEAGNGSMTMYPFKVKINNDTSELRHGFHVSLEIRLGGNEKALAVPHSAVIEDEGQKIVYVVKDDMLKRREIAIGRESDEYIEIQDGVKKGDLVVVSPNEDEMFDGMEVTSYDEIK